MVEGRWQVVYGGLYAVRWMWQDGWFEVEKARAVSGDCAGWLCEGNSRRLGEDGAPGVMEGVCDKGAGGAFFWMKIKQGGDMKKWDVKLSGREKLLFAGMTFIGVCLSAMVWAQPDGKGGLNQANTMIRSYFPAAADVLYGIGGLVGIVGSVRVYFKFSHNEPDTGRAAAAWFGACVFLVIVATVLKSFFGIAD